MKLIDDLKKKVETFSEGLKSGVFMARIIQEFEPEICDMNSENQLYERGVNNLGVEIMDYMPYTPKTIEIKEIKGQPTDRVTLRDEGDFHGSFFLQIYADRFEIRASDEKTECLEKKYGRQILGLTPDNQAELAGEYIFPELLTKARQILL